MRQEKEVHDEHLYEELKRLRKENARLKEERDILKKGGGVLRATAAVKYAWIRQQLAEFRVSRLCRMLEVSRSLAHRRVACPPFSIPRRKPIDSCRRKCSTILRRGVAPTARVNRVARLAQEGWQVSRRRIGVSLAHR